MHDLIPLDPALPAIGMLSEAEVDATMAYAQAEKAAATRKAYASDWRDFSRWCGARLAATLPAHPGIVASYLSDLAQQGCKASTIGRRAASIGYHHKLAGHEPPTNQEGVKVVLRGIRRTIGTARAGKAPATADAELRRELRHRQIIYPSLIKRGALTDASVDRQNARLQAALDVLVSLE